jgi:hypothetical protein
MDFTKTLIRSSSLGYLMTEPQSKSDREAGLLSKTAQKHLIEVYVAEKYGRRKDIQTKQMKKGIQVEDESIKLLSKFMNKDFYKNEERFTNEYITGMPDIITDDCIIDIKSSYDIWTFLGNLPDKLDSLYYWQMMCYMWLTNKPKAKVTYCLSNTPFGMIEQEKKSLFYKMDVISEESPEFIKESLKLEFNMTFDDMPIGERVLIFNVDRNEDDILRIQNKVEKAREYLEEIEINHMNFNR